MAGKALARLISSAGDAVTEERLFRSLNERSHDERMEWGGVSIC